MMKKIRRKKEENECLRINNPIKSQFTNTNTPTYQHTEKPTLINNTHMHTYIHAYTHIHACIHTLNYNTGIHTYTL